MKKIVFTIIAALFLATGVQAQIIKSTTVNVVNVPKEEKVEKVKTYPCYQGEFNVGYIATPYSGLIETVHGVRINKYLFAGVGFGGQGGYMELVADGTTFSSDMQMIFPIFANVKGYYPISNKIAPYLSLSLGGNLAGIEMFTTKYEESGSFAPRAGFFLDFSAGIRLNKFIIALGMTNNNFSTTQDSFGLQTKVVSRVSFHAKLGFQW